MARDSTTRAADDAVGGANDAARLLHHLEALREIPEAQGVVDALARATAGLAGFRVALITVALPAGLRVGGYNVSEKRVEYFRRRGAEVSMHEREKNRRRIRAAAFPGTDIAYIPNATRSFHVLPTDQQLIPSGAWHAEDALFILIRGTAGADIGICSLDVPESGSAPSSDRLDALRLAERLLGSAAPLIEARLFREEIEQSKECLRRSERLGAVGLAASGVAHDLGNLLVAIRAYAETTTADPEVHRMLARIQGACERGQRLVRRMLGRGDRPADTIDLRRFVAEGEEFLRGLVGPFVGLEIVPGDEPLPVAAEPGVLDQVLMNLVLNASEAISDGSTVRVECSRIDEYGVAFATLVVSDSGCGMDAETLDRVFEPLFTTKGEGSGLGLATVSRLVSELRGRMRVRSTRGEGTTALVQLPLAERDVGA